MSDTSTKADANSVADARRREMAVEHILFNSLRFIVRQNPGLLTELEGSLDHLWDHADDGTRDDEALREIARKFLKSLRAES